MIRTFILADSADIDQGGALGLYYPYMLVGGLFAILCYILLCLLFVGGVVLRNFAPFDAFGFVSGAVFAAIALVPVWKYPVTRGFIERIRRERHG